jgi:hypothetical protein
MEETYRARLIRSDGYTVARVKLICEDDASAREQAKLLARDCRVELWKGERKIAGFEPHSD